jgi:ParB-like chromosome segregation protein Spo0J
VRATIEQIEVIVYGDRDAADVAAYIGFRHVTGVLKWPSLEKAKYIARLVEDHGWTYERIAERLGSYPRHVERHYVAYRLVRQVSEEEIPGRTNPIAAISAAWTVKKNALAFVRRAETRSAISTLSL